MTPEPEEVVAVVAATAPTVYTLGSAYYFVPETLARGRELGLDGFRFYFLGRGGVLGDVEPPVVASAFGYFEPELLAKMWRSARERVAPREAGRAHLACAHAFGRAHFGEVEGLAAFCAAAEVVVGAADPAGLALFAGYAAEPLPDDPPARAMQLVAVLRELRGSAHLLAVVASGVAPVVAHALRRPDDVARFGWRPDQVPAIGEPDRRAHEAAERLTDRLLLPAYGALDEAGRSALVAGVDGMAAAAPGSPAT